MNGVMATATFYEKLDPFGRADKYEDPLEEWFENHPDIGEVDGGGTALDATGIACCEVGICIKDLNRVDEIIKKLEDLGAPRGSVFSYEDKKVRFGRFVGLGIRFPREELEKSNEGERNINFVLEELNNRLAGAGSINSYEETREATILYAYGESFDQMSDRISEFMQTNPLCATANTFLVPEPADD